MVFESVFDNLTEVQKVIENGRVDAESLVVNVDKNSIGVFLEDESQYFNGYDDDLYYMSPGGEHEMQVLFYGTFGRVEQFCIELLEEFFGSSCKEINYRADERSSDLI